MLLPSTIKIIDRFIFLPMGLLQQRWCAAARYTKLIAMRIKIEFKLNI